MAKIDDPSDHGFTLDEVEGLRLHFDRIRQQNPGRPVTVTYSAAIQASWSDHRLLSVENDGDQKELDLNGENPMLSPEQEEEIIKKKYGGMLSKKKPLISKDHERAFFDSADWALGKQGAQKPKGPLEALRPKLQGGSPVKPCFFFFFFLFQPTPQHQMRSRRSAYAPADDDDAEDGGNHASPEHENCESQGGDDKNSAPEDQTCNGGDDKNSAPGVQTCNCGDDKNSAPGVQTCNA
ncbi:hypothetical protein POTOM_036434 [Populus tomentosa]|uniref:cAMP-regulated phosphoprotein 19-related protein n=1 Tax=Populus tomentosa TaxID=118781 RepID=A0A8X7YUU7_POPTO|nr:hypothetical protein POTOM_036434 [Populus tomentosa]